MSTGGFEQAEWSPCTHIMVYAGQAMWDDIKILGHLVCTFVCSFVCVYVVGRY